MKEFLVDLHIHSVLSPCADRAMTPPAIVAAAISKGLGMIAICDHNSSSNAKAVWEAAQGRLAVLAGAEITTAEEVHVLGIFGDCDAADAVTRRLCGTMPSCDETYYQRYGQQSLCDSAGHAVATEPRMLAASCGFSLSTVVKEITNSLGVCIASHVDRPSFSVLSQLGVFPSDVAFDAIEVSGGGLAQGDSQPQRRDGYPQVPIVASSDAHRLEEIGGVCTVVRMQEASFSELVLAIKGVGGRRVERVNRA